MKRRLPIHELRVGMFIDAEVRSLLAEGEIRYYLEVRSALSTSASAKRLRLAGRKQEAVARDGGILLASWRYVVALRQAGVTEVVVDLDKSDVIPDRVVGREAYPGARRPSAPPAAKVMDPSIADAGGDDAALDLLDLPGPPAELPVSRPPSTSRGALRQGFGRSGAGWIKVEVAPDGAQAFLQVLSFGGDTSLGEQDLLQALEQLYGIRAGIDQELVRNLATQAAAFPTRVLRGQFPIARKVHPDPAQLSGVEYTFLKDLHEAAALPYAELRQALAAGSLAQVLAMDLRVRVVLPGEELAVGGPAGEQRAAQDIFGKAQAAATPEIMLWAGPHVALVDGRYLSEIYGYVCLLEGELSVIPPLWVSPDRMEAHYIYFPQVGPGAALTWAWLAEILARQEVRYGLCEAEIEALLQKPPAGTQAAALLVARGTPPRTSDEERIIRHFGATAESGSPRSGVELVQQPRYQLAAASAGQLLAEVRPATEQYSGIDLAGKPLPLPDAAAQGLKAGRNVRSELRDEVQYFYAVSEGYAKVAKGEIWVQPVVYVDQNVGGELDLSQTDQDLYIRGGVQAGGVVRVKGSVVVEGLVDEGAVIHAQGDVVAKGINGRDTRIVAVGDVETSFVQHASVTARGNITVTNHLMNAQIRAGGRLRGGGEGRGSISGGQAWASVAIEAGQAGSAVTTEDTLLGICPSPECMARRKKLDQGIEFCRTNILRIFRTLGMSEVDPVHLKELIGGSPPEKRQALLQVLGQLKELVATREKTLALKQELESGQARMMDEAEIRVSGSAFAGVQVQIGSAVLGLDQELHQPIFTITPSGIRWRSGK